MGDSAGGGGGVPVGLMDILSHAPLFIASDALVY